MKNKAAIIELAKFARIFIIRRDPLLFLHLALLLIGAAALLASFLFLMVGVRQIISDGADLEITQFGLNLALSPSHLIELGLVFIGISGILNICVALLGAHVATRFGVNFVRAFKSEWSGYSKDQRQLLIQLAKGATMFSRIVVRSFMPLSLALVGSIFLVSVSPFLMLGLLAVSVIALFTYIPAQKLVHQTSQTKNKIALNKDMTSEFEKNLHSFLLSTFELFVTRRLIAASSVLIIFLVLLGVYLTLGITNIVSLLDERMLIVLVLLRSTVMSLTRVTVGISMASKRIDLLTEFNIAYTTASLPENAQSQNFEDEEEF